jgi:hypothetical protein
MHTEIWSENLKGRDLLGDLRVDVLIERGYEGVDCTQVVQDRV